MTSFFDDLYYIMTTICIMSLIGAKCREMAQNVVLLPQLVVLLAQLVVKYPPQNLILQGKKFAKDL